MKILELTVQNVRGLRDLHLDLQGENIVIWGPNGSGKSCVVDAVEFLFSGRISRLMGQGTAGITLSSHGPHIDHEPKSASVKATIQLEGWDQPVQIERRIAEPDQLNCPEEAKSVLAKASDAIRSGAFVLTRRDILRYIAAEAGKRADEIEELLDLNDVDDVRSTLLRARNLFIRGERDAVKAVETAEAEVNVHLGLPKYSALGLLTVANECRQVLAAEPIEGPDSTSLKEGILSNPSREAGEPSVNLNLALANIGRLRNTIQGDTGTPAVKNHENLTEQITALKADPVLLNELERLQLTRRASHYVEESTVECPVCGARWPEGHLKSHLESRIATAQNAEVVRQTIVTNADSMATPARSLRANVSALRDSLTTSGLDADSADIQVLDSWVKDLDHLLTALMNPIEEYLGIGLDSVGIARFLAPKTITESLDRIEGLITETIPESTPEQTAWDTLTRLEVSLRVLESRARDRASATMNANRSKVLLEEYEKARDDVLNSLYSRISDRFVELYNVLHEHESDHFSATLQPQGASLNFAVDFMGRGAHPPHALHSEGHQDSMGVCLFLALNEEINEGDPSLIVLDDVMMSVDAGHRKDVCRLLKEHFTGCQFVITTHDRTWAKQLRQERVVNHRQVIEFTGWSVEHGPQTHRQMDLWETIEASLDVDDVNSAAFQLRRGSEEFFERACDALGAPIIYNSEMQWQLDDWLPAAMNQYKNILQRGRRSASSWGDSEKTSKFDERESIRKQIYDRTFVEQWTINASVHYNQWENMSKEDFSPVVDAFKDLQSLFECSECGRLLEKTPRKGNAQFLKCPCATVSWNLTNKPTGS